ncbi:MAG: nitronate monooxygenase [Gammaproteobacteria bacterium]|nr:nitronate monooxygenase [Gammaproteobacteria bacterium]
MALLTELLDIEVPLICGAMYPCSNPELVAAVSEAGAIGIVQPLSLSYVHGHEFRAGLRYIRTLTDKPIGVNLIIERSAEKYIERVRAWTDIAIEEGVKFFVTALGKPDWVVEKAHPAGIKVFHDVTSVDWANKALDCGVDGFICVNNRAGGHAGEQSPEQLLEEVGALGKPVVCAGGVGNAEAFAAAINMGYAGVQCGTRFITAAECTAHDDYKAAIVEAEARDVVLTDKISGVPVSVINTPYVQRIGTKAGPVARRLLQNNRTKHWMRTFYTLQSVIKLKKASGRGAGYKDYWQAGKSVDGISGIESAGDIVRRFEAALSPGA